MLNSFDYFEKTVFALSRSMRARAPAFRANSVSSRSDKNDPRKSHKTARTKPFRFVSFRGSFTLRAGRPQNKTSMKLRSKSRGFKARLRARRGSAGG